MSTSFREIKERYYKSRYLGSKRINDGYTYEQLVALRDMAKRDIYPDNRFSDQEVDVWSMFHNFHINKEEP